ncbi:MAG: TRL domain-containing protein [Leptospirales bacterium]|jgi:hypothetical protein
MMIVGLRKAFTTLGLVTALCFGLILSCIGGNPVGIGPVGGIYTKNTIGVSGNDVSELHKKSRRKKCSKRFAYAYITWAWGEGTVTDMLKRAESEKIYAVEKETFNILGVYSTLCTIIYVD